MPEITGFAFPNDIHVHWSLMIVMYPYITGFVAGAFIVTSLYHVFGREEFKPVARLAMATSFCFLLVATLPAPAPPRPPASAGRLVIVTPNFTSAMAGFGILYSIYLLDPGRSRSGSSGARRSSSRPGAAAGCKRAFYAALALGTYDTSPEAVDDRPQGRHAPGRHRPARRPACSTATSASSSAPSRPTPGGRRRSCRSSSCSRRRSPGIALLIILYQVVAKLEPAGRSRAGPCAGAGALALVLPHPHHHARAARDHHAGLREVGVLAHHLAAAHHPARVLLHHHADDRGRPHPAHPAGASWC